MSKNFKGYMGDQIGKLGTAVGRRWKRKMVYASYQGRVRNPRTESQTLVRARFSMLTEVAAIFQSAARKGLHHMAESRQTTECNCFVTLNYNKVNGTTPGALTLDPSTLVTSFGHLTGVVFNTNIDVTSVPNTVGVTVSDGNTSAQDASTSDSVYVFVYCPDANGGVLSVAAARAAGKIEVPVPASWSGLDVHVYGFTVGKTKASPTDYLGHATLN